MVNLNEEARKMGRNKKKCCIYCKKEFRGDYLPKHIVVCKQRPEKGDKRRVAGTGIEKYLNVEADHSDTDTDSELIIDEEEIEFIHDSEQENDDRTSHRMADNFHQQVKEKLRRKIMQTPPDGQEEVSKYIFLFFFYLKINRECCISFLHNT